MQILERVSIDKHDRGYAAFVRHGGFYSIWKITVDGEQVHAVTADPVEGKVVINDGMNPERTAMTRKIIEGVVAVFCTHEGET